MLCLVTGTHIHRVVSRGREESSGGIQLVSTVTRVYVRTQNMLVLFIKCSLNHMKYIPVPPTFSSAPQESSVTLGRYSAAVPSVMLKVITLLFCFPVSYFLFSHVLCCLSRKVNIFFKVVCHWLLELLRKTVFKLKK